MNTVSIRLEESQDKEIEEYAEKMKVDKSSATRKILDEGLKIIRLQDALEKIRLKKWTIWKAASYCNESYSSFLEKLRQENIPFPLSVEDLEREINDNSDFE